jgi:hypothetical protein
MTPADTIARTKLDAVVIVDRALREFPDVRSRASYIVAALTGAGYRILGPEELDGHTLERAAEICDVVADEHDALAIHAGSDDLTPVYRRGERAAQDVVKRLRSLQENPDAK